MAEIRIMFSRFSAFYSPLISTIACGFLAEEGLDPSYGVATPEKPARAAIADGSYHVTQSAVSSSWGPIERGEESDIVHFAQINLRDGFFLAARAPDPDFTWQRLAGRTVLVDHGGQPLAMFKYALHRMGVAYDAIESVDAGSPDEMVAAFRAGRGDFVHLQGPAPQQLEADGIGHVVASVGEAIGPVAFSSLAARRSWLETDMARAFMRAYRRARRYVNETPAEEIAAAEAQFFPGIDRAVLAATIGRYQALGCWEPGVAIPRDAYETALEVFLHAGLIARRHAYDAVCVAPPDEA